VGWAKDQFKECQQSHRLCNLGKQSTLPDRVLQIADSGSGNPLDESWLESDINLYESAGEQAAYATLSHRWGIQQPLRLLYNNASEFRRKILWASLSKIFQHAIVFARKLDIAYIWIDSLCIIQDSKDD
jgi:hypothetical protein